MPRHLQIIYLTVSRGFIDSHRWSHWISQYFDRIERIVRALIHLEQAIFHATWQRRISVSVNRFQRVMRFFLSFVFLLLRFLVADIDIVALVVANTGWPAILNHILSVFVDPYLRKNQRNEIIGECVLTILFSIWSHSIK